MVQNAIALEIENKALKRIIRDLISQARRSPTIIIKSRDNMTPIETTITKGQVLEAMYASEIQEPK